MCRAGWPAACQRATWPLVASEQEPETTAAGPYYFNFHQRDLGNFTVIGPSGSGKTVAFGLAAACSGDYDRLTTATTTTRATTTTAPGALVRISPEIRAKSGAVDPGEVRLLRNGQPQPLGPRLRHSRPQPRDLAQQQIIAATNGGSWATID